MNTCAATRLLLPAFLIGLGVSSWSGSDLYGWIAAGVTVGVLLAVQRIRGTATSCPMPAVQEHDLSRDVDGRADVGPHAPPP